MPPVDLGNYRDISQYAFAVVRSSKGSGKYLTLTLFTDLLSTKYGIVVGTGSHLQGHLRLALEKTCSHTLAIPVSVENSVINETCNAMIPTGIAGIVTDWGHRKLFFFSDVSDMITFRLLLPPMEIL